MKTVCFYLSKIGYAYPEKDFWVFKDLSLKVEKGDYLLISGPNGSGKTTLLKIFAGLLQPSYGNVEVSRSLKHKIGYVSQGQALRSKFPITVMDLILSGLLSSSKLCRFYSKKDRNLATLTLKKMGLEKVSNSYLRELSGGELQKSFIARALIGEPQCLIVDEPTGFVDKKSNAMIRELLIQFNLSGKTVIAITHDPMWLDSHQCSSPSFFKCLRMGKRIINSCS